MASLEIAISDQKIYGTSSSDMITGLISAIEIFTDFICARSIKKWLTGKKKGQLLTIFNVIHTTACLKV